MLQFFGISSILFVNDDVVNILRMNFYISAIKLWVYVILHAVDTAADFFSILNDVED